MRYFASVILAMVLGALAGSLIGWPVELLTGQSGWVLVAGSLGMNGGAFWAAARRAEGKPAWRPRA